LGFEALATTSSGLAWSRARRDNDVPRDEVLAHLAEMVAATDLPVNADFESGFAHDVAGVAESVRLATETGVAGISIEDSTGNPSAPLYELPTALERIRAARRAIDRAGGDTLLVGRVEAFLVGLPDLDMTIARLKAYSDAGADCLYAPGLRTSDHVRSVVAALRPKPINVLVSGAGSFTLKELADLGVRRVSVGGALARAAWGGFMRAAREMAEHGTFNGLAAAPAHAEVNALFSGPATPPRARDLGRGDPGS
jgi:2-methylisocitrate lyase-like PEP mutase family enzyme